METELGALLYQLSDAMMGGTRISITTSVSGERPLPADVQLALYRIAQELLNNVVKHAAASQATVGLYFSDDDLLLRVSDDGRGFDLQTLPPVGWGSGSWLSADVPSELTCISTAKRAKEPRSGLYGQTGAAHDCIHPHSGHRR